MLILQKTLNLEDEVRRLKASTEQFPIVVRINLHEASNLTYIHAFWNVVRVVHLANLDVVAVWAKKKDMLISYM